MVLLAETLAELHRIYRQLSDLRDRMERGPKQVKLADANVKKCEAEHQQAKDAYKTAKIAADEKQLQLRSREAKLLDWQGKLMQAQNNREYQALKDQIAADNQANAVLSDEILEALERLDVLQSNIKSAAETLTKTQDELAKIRKRIEEQQQGLEIEFARVSTNLKDAEAKLPEDVREDFLRVSKVRGDDAMAAVDGECCGGCYQMLTQQTLELLRQDKLVFCKACGRLIYIVRAVL
jgi:predicted  nucleic acid-binding Zn-ribbon protein